MPGSVGSSVRSVTVAVAVECVVPSRKPLPRDAVIAAGIGAESTGKREREEWRQRRASAASGVRKHERVSMRLV